MREKSTPDVGEALFRLLQERQVPSQLVELFLLETFCVTVGGGLVVRTPPGRKIATFSFLTLLLPTVGTVRLRDYKAFAIEVAGSVTVVTLDAA